LTNAFLFIERTGVIFRGCLKNSRSVKIGVGAVQKDYLGNFQVENRRYMASEGNKIQRETLNRLFP
jgi:hypothetical protein